MRVINDRLAFTAGFSDNPGAGRSDHIDVQNIKIIVGVQRVIDPRHRERLFLMLQRPADTGSRDHFSPSKNNNTLMYHTSNPLSSIMKTLSIIKPFRAFQRLPSTSDRHGLPSHP